MTKMKTNNGPQKQYWRTNVIVISILLGIWCIASCCCSILFIEQLNEFKIGNLPFGFWMANQGSMLTFVILILVYAVIMDWADRRFQKSIREGQHDH